MLIFEEIDVESTESTGAVTKTEEEWVPNLWEKDPVDIQKETEKRRLHELEKQLANQSILSRSSDADSVRFVQTPWKWTRSECLNNMTVTERMLFEFLVLIRPLSVILEIAKFGQKTDRWKWGRMARITGSATGSATGHNRENRIVKAAHDSVFKTFVSIAPTEWGSVKETYGAKCYYNDLKRIVDDSVRKQQCRIRKRGYFKFRGQRIPIEPNKEAVVEIRHYGLLIDPWNHWRGVSPDGVVFINEIAVGALEIKCPYAKQKSLYTNIKMYYYNQLQCELYSTRRFWPTIRWLDFVVWSPRVFYVERFFFDVDYFYKWYVPRELRYYFGLYLPAMTEKMRLLTIRDCKGDEIITPLAFLKTLKKYLSLPAS